MSGVSVASAITVGSQRLSRVAASSRKPSNPDTFSGYDPSPSQHTALTNSNPPSRYSSATPSEHAVQDANAGTVGVIMV